MDQLIEADEDLKAEESISLPNIVTKRMARFFMDSASASSANGNLLDLGLDSETILTVRSVSFLGLKWLYILLFAMFILLLLTELESKNCQYHYDRKARYKVGPLDSQVDNFGSI